MIFLKFDFCCLPLLVQYLLAKRGYIAGRYHDRMIYLLDVHCWQDLLSGLIYLFSGCRRNEVWSPSACTVQRDKVTCLVLVEKLHCSVQNEYTLYRIDASMLCMHSENIYMIKTMSSVQSMRI